ncbi:MAG: glycerophosphodiester phosphodiesterase [Clostridia bacterium]|nr:glycerophosphodiester phosphodiesterase [Clostridia bacterium]
MKKDFINYAHRGASEYAPENTLLSFYTGLFMQANGIETDVQLTKDGVPVLFHDDTVDRVTDGKGKVYDYTLKELKSLWVLKNGYKDKIITFEEFLDNFAHFDLTFAIELKGDKTAIPTADLIRKFGIENKVIATSFKYNELLDMRSYAPEIRTGYLVYNRPIDDELIEQMKADGLFEICPRAPFITLEKCKEWHDKGFSVRAWGVANEELMKQVYFAGADGMTVNFPDKLCELIKNNER